MPDKWQKALQDRWCLTGSRAQVRGEAFWKKTMPKVNWLLSCLPVHGAVFTAYASGAPEHKEAWGL